MNLKNTQAIKVEYYNQCKEQAQAGLSFPPMPVTQARSGAFIDNGLSEEERAAIWQQAQDDVAAEANTVEDHDPDLRYLKKPWKGAVFCTLDVIRAIHEGSIATTACVWPDEGRFNGKLWHFNEKHEGFEPLLIDRISAGAMIAVHDALKAENQAKMKDWVQRCRGHFAKMYELSMERVSITFVGR